ncbi:capsule biosynthesis protein [Algirhabdus cladophorae]|uniref:capsule biosynthesis protein n=1 Tax=Algirhabdus cladophorae TaxID=3377108 RepID=UPI003B848A00
MTTKPKAKKFRIRRSAPAAPTQTPPPAATTPSPAPARPTPQAQPASGAQPAPQTEGGQAFAQITPKRIAVEGDVASKGQVTTENTIDAIRKEGLTGRQLRMARRVAQKHNLAPISDFDAVRLLRENGVDPFQQSSMLELVVPDQNDKGAKDGALTKSKIQLPQTVPSGDANLPSTELGPNISPAEARAAQIAEIQAGIASRRRKKMAVLVTRLAFFVFLPTLIAGYYFYSVATPMYATNSEFLIQKSEAQSPGALGSVFGGSGLATSQDSIAVQGYLGSREAMQRLNEDVGFISHFSAENIDVLQRLEPDASNSTAYKLYKKYVKIGYDPTEGVIKMEVIAADPTTSELYARKLIEYAEERVDGITGRVREDAMKGARASFEDAERKRESALQVLANLQESTQILDPAGATAELQSRLAQLETRLLDKELQLAGQLENSRPNQARVNALETEVRITEAQIQKVKAEMTTTGSGTDSQARINAQIRVAEENYQTRTLLEQQALQQLETARIESERQVRYLSLGVEPTAPDDPTYPRKFENTVLAFLIFAGIYLMFSLTASILREQVSS